MNTRTILILSFALLALSALSGCSSVKVRSTYDKEFDFSKLTTFRVQAEVAQRTDPRLNDAALRTRLETALSGNLQKKGYTPDASAENFYLTYHVRLKHRSHLSTSGGPQDPVLALMDAEQDGSTESHDVQLAYSHDVDQASLSVKAVDLASNKVVWSGYVRKVVHLDAPSEEKEKNVQKAVDLLLKDFPGKS